MNEITLQNADHHYKLRVLKTWFCPDPGLIFQCSPQGPADVSPLPKKLHLIFDLRQQSFGVRLQLEKPAAADANHAFIQILRKQCPNFSIKFIYFDSSSGNFWIPLLSGLDFNQFWTIYLSASKPPLASLLAPDQTIHVSFGQKGTFTKKHKSDVKIPEIAKKNILVDLFLDFIKETNKSEAALNLDSPAESADDRISKAQRDLASRLKRKLKTSKKTLEKLQKDLPSADQTKVLDQTARLLQSYAWMIKPGAFILDLEEALTTLGYPVAIDLDPELSPGKNVDLLFTKSHKARRGREIGLKQIDLTLNHCLALTNDIASLREQQKTDHDLSLLARKYRLPELQPHSTEHHPSERTSLPYKTYKSSTGHSILVGKSAIENDELTKKARSNDFWLHAVGVTGSHVIVPVTPDIRHSLPTQLLKEAAILALYFSKLRDDQAGESYVTRKAHLKKQRGMPAGLWRIDKSESLFFRYQDHELQRLLATVQV